jgi:cobalt/nickel transport system ATP-binding protein
MGQAGTGRDENATAAVLAAGIFAIQAINLPIGMGTSGHMVRAVLAAIILGSPYAGLLLLTLVLVVQAFVFYDGGITTLGANIFNMGLVSCWSGYYTYRWLEGRVGTVKASFAGAWVGLFLTAIVATFEIYLAGAFPLIEALVVMGTFHAIIGFVGEGFITAIVVKSIMAYRPDIMKLEQRKPISRILLGMGLLLAKFSRKKQDVRIINDKENVTSNGTENRTENGWVSQDRDWGTPYIIETRNLMHEYHSHSTKALNGIDFCVRPGERIVLLGANGAGKSTLFKHLNGILKPTSGEVLIKGQSIDRTNIKEVRRTVGVVFQNPDDQIFSPTVAQDVAFGPMNLGLSEKEIERRVKRALEMVRLTGYEDRAPHHLSGGEKKRVAIAGILAMKPEVLILDEPTTGLDPGAAARLMRMIMEMNRNLGITMIIATHEVDLVPAFAQRICVLSAGRIIGEGTPAEIFSRPDLIAKTHLRLPLVAQLMEQLKEADLDVEVALTIDGAKSEILKALGR